MSGCHRSPACGLTLSVWSQLPLCGPRAGSVPRQKNRASLPGDQPDAQVKACRNEARKWDFDRTDKVWRGLSAGTSDTRSTKTRAAFQHGTCPNRPCGSSWETGKWGSVWSLRRQLSELIPPPPHARLGQARSCHAAGGQGVPLPVQRGFGSSKLTGNNPGS